MRLRQIYYRHRTVAVYRGGVKLNLVRIFSFSECNTEQNRLIFVPIFVLFLAAAIVGCSKRQEDASTLNNQDKLWQPIGPYGLEVQALALAPSDPNTIYAAGPTGDVFKSIDAGKFWEKLSSVGVSVRTLAIHPRNPKIVFAGSDVLGLQKSIDGGKTWQGPDAGLELDPFVYAIAIHPKDPNILYAGTFKSKGSGGIYKSTNGGMTWQPSKNGMRDEFVLSIAIDPQNPGVLYAGTFSGQDYIYKSSDGGNNWQAINRGLGRRDVYAIAIDPKRTNRMYAATGGAGVYRSDIGGENWYAINEGLASLDVRALVIDPRAPETLYASSASGIFKTTNGGLTWYMVNFGVTNRLIVNLAINPKNSKIVYAGALGVSADNERGSYMGAVFKTQNGGRNWEWASTGLIDADARAIVFEAGNPQIIYAGLFGRGVYRSLDGGKTWQSALEGRNLGLSGPDILDLNIDPRRSGVLLAASYSKGIFKTNDAGMHWEQVWPDGRVQVLARDPIHPDTIYAGAHPQGMLRSVDGGNTWEQFGLAKPGIYALAIDPVETSTLYAGINALPPEGGVYKTSNGGKTWKKSSSGVSNPLIRALAIHPEDRNNIFAGSVEGKNPVPAPKLYRSTNAAGDWTEFSQDHFQTFALLIDPLRPNIMYNGKVYFGVSRSVDGGVTWTSVNEGLSYSNVLELAFQPLNPDIVYAGTTKGGIYRADFSRLREAKQTAGSASTDASNGK